ncbi:MAG: hypothetical protein AAF850_08465 [Pseudomonadota bacterium]
MRRKHRQIHLVIWLLLIPATIAFGVVAMGVAPVTQAPTAADNPVWNAP